MGRTGLGIRVWQALAEQLGAEKVASDYCEACGLELPQVRQCADLRGRWTEFTVRRCLGCGLGRTEPQPGDPYLEAAARENEQQLDQFVDAELARTAVGSPWSREFGRALAEQQVPEPVLDLGCGHGDLLEVLAGAGISCEGVEMRPLCAAVSRRRAGVPVETGTIDTFLSRPHHVGTIVLSHVLEHLPQPAETLRALACHADAIAVAVPNSLSVRALVEWSLKPGGFAYAPDEHLWQMTPAAVRGIFKRAHLQLTYLGCHANAPARASWRSLVGRLADQRAPVAADTAAAFRTAAPVSTDPKAPRRRWLSRGVARAADRALFEVERHLRLPWVGEQVIAIGRTPTTTRIAVSATEGRAEKSSELRPRWERKLVVLKTSSTEVWDYTLLALERHLDRAGVAQLDARRLGANSLLARGSVRFGLLRNFGRLPGLVFFKAMMTPAAWRLFPTEFLFETVLYCLDCFPPVYADWERLFHRLRSRMLFFSSRQAAAHFRARLPRAETVWLPEATDPAEYEPRVPLAHRRIDVLELGRRHGGYHDLIAPALAAAIKMHRYEREPGQIVFPTKEHLVEGLAQSKISVCFPCSLTHPARSGDAETVTHRYFESIASKCLLVGHGPAELRDLFGYDPVVPVDWSDPGRQIVEIVNHIDEYQPEVERNYQRLLEVGTWEVRTRTMLDLLRARGSG